MPTTPITPIAVSISDAVRLLGLSRSTLYRLMDKGSLTFVKVTTGRRLIPYSALQALVARPAA